MKRLFAIIGFAYLITLTVFIFIPVNYYWIFLSIFLICEIISLILKNIRKEKTLPIIFLVCIISSCAYLVNYYNFIVPTQALYDKDLIVTGQVCELAYKQDDKIHYVLKVEKIEGYPNIKNFKINVSTYNVLSLDIYDTVTVNIHTFSYENSKFDIFKQYNFSKKVYLSGYILEDENFPIINNTDNCSLYQYSLNIRKNIMSFYRRMFSEEYSSIVNGVIFGDRYNMPDNIKNNFISSGIYHILAVSGIHTTIISQMILSILLRLRVNKRLSALLSALSVFLFMSVSCFTPSVVRAGIMSIIYLIGLAIYRQSDTLNSLGISVLIIALINPNIGGSISLWLSFLSTLGIIVLHPKIFFCLRNKFKSENKIVKYILESVSITTSVILFTFPVCAIVFKKIYLSSFISNILILPFIPLLIFNSFVCVVLYYILFPFQIWKLFGIINVCIIRYMNGICSFLSNVSFLRIFLNYEFIEIFVLISLLILGIVFILDNLRQYTKIIFMLILNTLMITCLFSRFLKSDDVVISILNSSDNFSALLSKGRGHTAIYCSGDYPKYRDISNYLYNINACKLDFFILPKFNIEQFKTVNKVMDEYGAYYIIAPDRYEFEEETKMINNFKCKKYLFDQSFKIGLYGEVNIFIFKLENKSWIYIEVYGKKILCCLEGGDILKLPGEFRKADILISSGLPNNFNYIDGLKDIIFASSRKNYRILESKINHHNINNFYTGKSTSIELRLKRSGFYKISEEI